MAGSCNADVVAKELRDSLLVGKDFTMPDVDFDSPEFDLPDFSNDPIFAAFDKLENDDLTTRVVGGSGAFDALMAGIKAHLKEEYQENRLTGDAYAKSYVAISESAIGNAVQFLLGRDQAYWAAVTAQQQAKIAAINLVTAKVAMFSEQTKLRAIQYEALTQEATYAVAMMRLSNESAQYCTAEYNLEFMLPKQLELLNAQISMTNEQLEAARGQTLDTRTDGLPITGAMGKQKDLYTQQIISYQRDAEVKTAKLFTDAWITMKTIDEGLPAPTGFTNASLDVILTHLKANNDLS